MVTIVYPDLSIAAQRRAVEAAYGGPCFRMWCTAAEWDRMVHSGQAANWTSGRLTDGRVAVWRPEADLKALPDAAAAEINGRRLADDVT